MRKIMYFMAMLALCLGIGLIHAPGDVDSRGGPSYVVGDAGQVVCAPTFKLVRNHSCAICTPAGWAKDPSMEWQSSSIFAVDPTSPLSSGPEWHRWRSKGPTNAMDVNYDYREAHGKDFSELLM